MNTVGVDDVCRHSYHVSWLKKYLDAASWLTFEIYAMRIVLVVVACMTALSNPFAHAADVPPNIVVLLCDDLGYGDLACFGHPQIKTPNIDRLASEGLKLTHCYAAAPVCSPSRGGLLTGRNPYRLGIRDWIPAQSGVFLRPGEVTVPQLLRTAGYQTCHVGKWHLNSRINGSEPTPGDAGFDYWMYTQNNAAPNHLDPTNFVRMGKQIGKQSGPSSHVIVQEAMSWLDKTENRPFYLNVWFHEPHEKIAAEDKYVDLYPGEADPDRRHYMADVSQMDAAVGRLMQYLDEHGLRETTFVFFSSDNGPETKNRYQGSERSQGSPGPFRGMKLHLSEGGIRVPGVMRWPGQIRPGTESTQPVCSVDLLPTFCALAGIRPPQDRSLDGASLLPLFEGRPIQRSHPLYWQYDKALNLPWVVALRDGPWKLLANQQLDRFQLFNLEQDPGEQVDLASERADQVASLAALMKTLHTEINQDGAKSGNPIP